MRFIVGLSLVLSISAMACTESLDVGWTDSGGTGGAGANGASTAAGGGGHGGGAGGTVEPEECSVGQFKCNGVCVTTEDPAYGCGTCAPCAIAHGSATCVQGACAVKACEPERADCNHDPKDGCEADLTSDHEHCGACITPCAASEVCNAKSCAADCGLLTNCDGSCVDLLSNADHCGTCDKTCDSPPASSCYQVIGTCSNASCSYAYADGASCSDGDACTIGDSCASGVCAGTPMVCDAPPAATCISATTLRTYSSPGTCAAGACEYAHFDTECASGCSGGMCSVGVSPTVVSVGALYTCAGAGGAAKCWGLNLWGTLGNNSTDDSPVPVSVTGLSSGIVAVSAGDDHTCALTSSGAVMCWGVNNAGQLGNNSAATSFVPVSVTGLSSGVVAVSGNGGRSCARTSAGALMCWGSNNVGQLGNNSTDESHIPVPVTGLSSGVIAMSVGLLHTCAVTSAGEAMCWGFNSSGSLGNSSLTESHIPVPVTGLSSGVVDISAGYVHTCAVTSAGAVMCWGRNTYGELGDNSTADSDVPVPVTGLSSGVVAVSAGSSHTCALTSAGAVLCWGENYRGQLGNNSTADSHIPVPVTGLSSGVVAVSAGYQQTCVFTSAGAVLCWGLNNVGQLGNNSTADSPIPVNVVGY